MTNHLNTPETIAAYLEGTLDVPTRAAFDALLERDAAFAEQVFFQKMSQETIAEAPALNRLRQTLDKLNHLQTDSIGRTYNTETLTSMFATNTELEAEILSNTEPSVLQQAVTAPVNEAECLNNVLDFLLKSALPVPLRIVIFDNQKQVLTADVEQIAANTTYFLVRLLPSTLPGRYYWKLSPVEQQNQALYGTAKGSFWIEKELMPE